MQFSSVFFVFRVQKSQLITLYIYCTTKIQSDWRFECNDADLSPKNWDVKSTTNEKKSAEIHCKLKLDNIPKMKIISIALKCCTRFACQQRRRLEYASEEHVAFHITRFHRSECKMKREREISVEKRHEREDRERKRVFCVLLLLCASTKNGFIVCTMLRFSQRCVSQLDRKQMKRNIVRNRIAMPKSTKERKKKKWMQRRAEAITTNEFYINYHNYLIKIWRRQSKSHLIMKQLIIKQQNRRRDGRKPRVTYTGWWFRRTIKAGFSHARRLHLM